MEKDTETKDGEIDIDIYLKNIEIFSFLLHVLNMPGFLALVINTMPPFMYCSGISRTGAPQYFHSEDLSYISPI